MPGYGLEALKSMYEGPSQMEKKNLEYTRTQQALTAHRNEIAQKEAADAKMQAYDAQVDQFADKLLAPDRTALFRTAKIMKQSIREVIKNNGGNLKDFFANGGHQVMGDYKSAVIRSKEASDYIENKEKMTMILKLMNEGKSHLLSPVDQANFDSYFKNGGGKLTYSGTMGEIKMPDPSKYRYGETIPVQDILNENRATILSNYSIYNKGTDKDPVVSGKLPSEAELLAFTAGMYGSATGSNYQRDIALENQNIAWNQEQRAQAEFPLELQSKALSNEGQRLSNEGQELSNQTTQRNLLNPPASSASGASVGSSGTSSEGDIYSGIEKEIEYNDFHTLGTIAGETSLTVGSIVTDWDKKFENGNDGETLKTILNGRWKDSGAKEENYKGSWDMGYSGGSLFGVNGSRWTPAVASRLFKDPAQAERFKKHSIERMGLTYEKGTIKGLQLKKGMVGVYGFDGTSLSNGHPSLSGDFKNEALDYTVREVITAPVTDANGNRQIVMNRDGKLSKEGYGVADKARPSTFLVLEAKRGSLTPNRRIYIEVDPTNTSVQTDLAAPLNVTKAVKQQNLRNTRRTAEKQNVALVKKEFDLVANAVKQSPAHQAVTQMISPHGSRDRNTEDYMQAFYHVIKSMSPNRSFPEIANSYANEVLSMVKKAENTNLMGRLRAGKVTPHQFFESLKQAHQNDPMELEQINQWRSVYTNLKNVK